MKFLTEAFHIHRISLSAKNVTAISHTIYAHTRLSLLAYSNIVVQNPKLFETNRNPYNCMPPDMAEYRGITIRIEVYTQSLSLHSIRVRCLASDRISCSFASQSRSLYTLYIHWHIGFSALRVFESSALRLLDSSHKLSTEIRPPRTNTKIKRQSSTVVS